MSKIEKNMEKHGPVTLKALALTFELNPTRMYTVAKQPKEGEIYDAKKYNWDAIETFIMRRLNPDGDLKTLEDVMAKAREIDIELQEADKRKAANRGGGVKKVEVDGKLIPLRKFPTFEADSKTFIVLRKDPRVFKIVYQTVSHTVMVPVKDASGEPADQNVKLISNSMLNMYGVGPANLEKEIQVRFAGEYKGEPTATATAEGKPAAPATA